MVVNQDLPRPYVEPGSRTEIIHARDYHATAAAGTPSPLTKQDHPPPIGASVLHSRLLLFHWMGVKKRRSMLCIEKTVL